MASRGTKTITAEEEHPISGKEAAPVIDQHAWLDPKNGIVYVRNIAQALGRSDPANADDYKARAAAYIKQLQAVDAWMRTEMATVPTVKRRIIASHDSLQYLAKACGITLISINGWTNKSEPSAAELARLAQQIEAEHVHALFLDRLSAAWTPRRPPAITGGISPLPLEPAWKLIVSTLSRFSELLPHDEHEARAIP